MKTASKLLVGLSIALLIGVFARADEKSDAPEGSKDAPKEVKLKGTITCAKCDLKLEKKCATVVKVKKDDKETIYYFDPMGNKKFHGDTCMEAKTGTVTGSVAEKDGKHWVKVSKVDYDSK
jgi:hypothetical protein